MPLGVTRMPSKIPSRRNDTRADRMDNHVSDAIKKDRAESVRRLSERTKRRYRNTLVGSVQDVLVERAEVLPDGSMEVRGLTASYVPLRFPLPGSRSPEDVQNCMFRVRVDNLESGDDPDLIGVVQI